MVSNFQGVPDGSRFLPFTDCLILFIESLNYSLDGRMLGLIERECSDGGSGSREIEPQYCAHTCI